MSALATAAGATALGLAANSLGVTAWASARWPAQGRKLATPFGPVHALDEGAGPAVLGLHGAASTSLGVVAPMRGRLAGLRLIAPDRPGAGHTPAVTGHDRLARQAEVVAAVLDACAVARAVVYAHSWGCAVALRLALDFPDRVAALVLCAPASHPWPGDTSLVNRLAASPVLGHVLAFIAPPLLGPHLAPAAVARGFAPAPVPEGYAQATGVPLSYRPASFRANARDMAAANRELAAQAPRYGEIACPLAVVTGEGDRIVANRIHAGGLRDALPGLDSRRVPGGGHMPHWVAADLVAGLIRQAALSPAR